MKCLAALALLLLSAGFAAAQKNSPQATYQNMLVTIYDTARAQLAAAQEDESAFYRRLGWDDGTVRGMIDLNTFLPCLEKRRTLVKFYQDSAARVKILTPPDNRKNSHEKFLAYVTAKAEAETAKLATVDNLLAVWRKSLAQDEKTAVFPAEKIHSAFNFWPADTDAEKARQAWAVTYNAETAAAKLKPAAH